MDAPETPTADETRVPGQSLLLKVVIALFGGVLAGLTIYVTQLIEGVAILLTSIVSSAVLIVTAPNLRQCHPVRIIASHSIAMVVGLLVHWAFGNDYFAISAAVTVSLALVLIADALHPPAIANSAFPFAVDAAAVELVAITLASACILALASILAAKWSASNARPQSRLAKLWFRRRAPMSGLVRKATGT